MKPNKPFTPKRKIGFVKNGFSFVKPNGSGEGRVVSVRGAKPLSVMGEQEENDSHYREQQRPFHGVSDTGVGIFGGQSSSCHDSGCKRSVSGSGLFHRSSSLNTFSDIREQMSVNAVTFFCEGGTDFFVFGRF